LNHWYDGAEPPFTGVALKVTGTPWQTWRLGFDKQTMETLGGSFVITTCLIWFETAGFPVAQE